MARRSLGDDSAPSAEEQLQQMRDRGKGGPGKAPAEARSLELPAGGGERHADARRESEETGERLRHPDGQPLSLGPSQVEMESERNPGVRSTRIVASNQNGGRGDLGLEGDRGVPRQGAAAAGGVVASAAAGGSLAAYGGGSSASAGGSSAAYGGPSATAGAQSSSPELLPDVQRPPGLPQGDDRGIPQGGSTMIHDAGSRGGVILPQQVNPFSSPERRAW